MHTVRGNFQLTLLKKSVKFFGNLIFSANPSCGSQVQAFICPRALKNGRQHFSQINEPLQILTISRRHLCPKVLRVPVKSFKILIFASHCNRSMKILYQPSSKKLQLLRLIKQRLGIFSISRAYKDLQVWKVLYA